MGHDQSWRPPSGDKKLRPTWRGISESIHRPVMVEIHELHEEPHKPRLGLLVYADGTDWNPGSGEGLYVYKSGGWTFIA